MLRKNLKEIVKIKSTIVTMKNAYMVSSVNLMQPRKKPTHLKIRLLKLPRLKCKEKEKRKEKKNIIIIINKTGQII